VYFIKLVKDTVHIAIHSTLNTQLVFIDFIFIFSLVGLRIDNYFSFLFPFFQDISFKCFLGT